MGGLGKTTLARKIYHHHTIKACFAGLAWVSISQKWQRKQVLQRILICLVREKKEEILTWNEDKLGENLLDIQQTKKCLIVLDDIWSTDAWDSLKGVIPSEGSISKIMLTTRIVNVAEHANPNGFIHRPVLLSPEKKLGTTPVESTSSRRRLSSMPDSGLRNSQKYAKYRNKAISITSDITRDVTKMEELGREMVGNCGGLPLAIVTLGGILATKPSLIEWNKVHDDIISSLKSGKGLGRDYQSQILNILGWSYNDLPPQLKPCFLYLGKFGEDESIDAETLYQLWIAEGMVQSSDKKEGETMMKVAESYLGELVHKSMVQVRFNDVKSSINFESCSLHDLMRDLAVSQAEAEEFFKVIDLREENDFHSSPSADFRPCNTRQLIVHLGDGYRSKRSYDYFGKKADQQRYRSMLVFNKFGLRRSPPARGSHIANFRCLRVLSIEDESYPPRSGSFSRINLRRVLGILVYLRYLRISYDNLLFFHRYKS